MWENQWLEAQHAADQRRFQQVLAGSFVAHLLVFAGLAFSPSSDPPPLPAVLRVDLIAGLPSAPAQGAPRAAPKAAAKPPPKALPPPAPKAVPVPAPPPQPKQVVLPKQAPKAVPKKRVVAPPPRPEPVEYDDAMAQLRSELGEATPSPGESAEQVSDADLLATAKPGAGSASGAPSNDAANAAAALDKQIADWVLATQRHVRERWITPPEFRNRGLETVLEVELTGSGVVRGEPRIVRSSGDPFVDDNAVRALMKSSPLPAPPSAGTWTFSFSED